MYRPGDDLTRNLIVHHNVVWNCANKGFIIKGDRNQVYNNSAVNNPQLDMVLWSAPEPHKQWSPGQWEHLLKQQNVNSRAYNNYAPVLTVAGITDGFLGDAPDVGAYEHNASEYWISGYRAPNATMPIPPNGASVVKADADLMWLAGRRAASHLVYLGSDRAAIAVAKQFRGSFQGNIFSPSELVPGQKYFWRVDVRTRDGVTVKGPVWEFKVAAD